MKIWCSVCDAAEAAVLCSADEATLCRGCDEKVHATNSVASKHKRVWLSSSASKIPKCDICQETRGYFFCLEDRALRCRKCDVAKHSANPLVSKHQRFLLTGVKVGLEATEEEAPQSSSSDNTGKAPTVETQALSKDAASISQYSRDVPIHANLDGEFTLPETPAAGSAAGTTSQGAWMNSSGLGTSYWIITHPSSLIVSSLEIHIAPILYELKQKGKTVWLKSQVHFEKCPRFFLRLQSPQSAGLKSTQIHSTQLHFCRRCRTSINMIYHILLALSEGDVPDHSQQIIVAQA